MWLAPELEAQVSGRVNESPWHAIQAGESADADNQATRLVAVRYIFRRMCTRIW